MHGTHNPWLVALSVFIAVVAFYTALDLAGSVRLTRGRGRLAWLAGGSLAMGTGIWSMHFIGMLAFGIPGLPIAYDVGLLVLSVVVAILASAAALVVVARERVRAVSMCGASLALGVAIAGMHYIGMWSMRVPAVIEWNGLLVAASIAIAVGASFLALWLALRSNPARARRIRLAGGVVGGLAIAGMHYTAMAAAHFTAVEDSLPIGRGDVLATDGLAVAVTGTTLLVLCIALAGSVVGRELARRQTLAVENARLYQEAQEANQAKAEFLANMSHELRTPLNAMIGYTDLLLSGIPEPLPPASQRYVERIGWSAQHLLQIIEEILTYSRLEAGREEVRVERLDLVGLVAEIGAVIEPLAQRKGIGFRIDAPAEPLVVETDPRKVRQILLNLLGNAIKFTEAGEVELRIAGEEEGVCFAVRDTGIGIPAELREAVFEPFRQVDGGRARTAEGTGLGLTVTRRLARLLGGDVTLRSEPGHGSTFTVRLPARAAERVAA